MNFVYVSTVRFSVLLVAILISVVLAYDREYADAYFPIHRGDCARCYPDQGCPGPRKGGYQLKCDWVPLYPNGWGGDVIKCTTGIQDFFQVFILARSNDNWNFTLSNYVQLGLTGNGGALDQKMLYHIRMPGSNGVQYMDWYGFLDGIDSCDGSIWKATMDKLHVDQIQVWVTER